jgi:hypothetical protein
MRGRLSRIVAIGALVAGPLSALSAQGLSSPKCVSGGGGSIGLIAQDACQQAYDVYQLLAPQLGLALTGGNATAGQGSVLGGLGHFSIGVRVNAFGGLIPNTSGNNYPVSINGAQQRTLPTRTSFFGLPTADAAIGLFKGFPLALTNVLGVDALVSGEYVPTINGTDFSLTPSSNYKFGYGARVGLLSESIAFPAVSFTWIERDLPSVDISTTSNNNETVTTLDITGMDVKTRAWRLVASKSLILFSVAAGIGRDSYKQSATIEGTVTESGAGGHQSIDLAQAMDRTNMFGDLAINLRALKIVLEVGDAIGGSVQTFNSFSGGSPDRSQLYGSLGFRVGR